MKQLDQRILLAAILLSGALAVINSNLPAAIIAVALLAAWTALTLRRDRP